MDWLVRFYLRNDTKQKWMEIVTAAVLLCCIALLILAART